MATSFNPLTDTAWITSLSHHNHNFLNHSQIKGRLRMEICKFRIELKQKEIGEKRKEMWVGTCRGCCRRMQAAQTSRQSIGKERVRVNGSSMGVVWHLINYRDKSSLLLTRSCVEEFSDEIRDFEALEAVIVDDELIELEGSRKLREQRKTKYRSTIAC